MVLIQQSVSIVFTSELTHQINCANDSYTIVERAAIYDAKQCKTQIRTLGIKELDNDFTLKPADIVTVEEMTENPKLVVLKKQIRRQWNYPETRTIIINVPDHHYQVQSIAQTGAVFTAVDRTTAQHSTVRQLTVSHPHNTISKLRSKLLTLQKLLVK